MRPIHYEGWQRIEPLEIPDEALREILYNAIIHKEYRGGEITIRVFKDRLEIWNPGNLPASINRETHGLPMELDGTHKNTEESGFSVNALGSTWNSGYVCTQQFCSKMLL